jgi:hypothetical protein
MSSKSCTPLNKIAFFVNVFLKHNAGCNDVCVDCNGLRGPDLSQFVPLIGGFIEVFTLNVLNKPVNFFFLKT